MAIGGLHGAGRVTGGGHRLLDEGAEAVERGRGRRRWRGWNRRCRRAGGGGIATARSQFVETDGGGLAKVHRGLARVGGDLDKRMAQGEIFAGEAVLFRAEDESDVSIRRKRAV